MANICSYNSLYRPIPLLRIT